MTIETMNRWTVIGAASLLLSAGLFVACESSGGGAADYQADPELGATSFISALPEMAEAGRATGGAANTAGGADGSLGEPAVDDGASGSGATVEEGDIFRLLDDGRILNLNSYRGLQIIDVSDPSAPELVGSLRMAGQPVEMYAVGDTVVVLMNSWRGYYGSIYESAFETFEGGVVMTVDIADPTNPVMTDHEAIAGDIRKSRLRTEGADVSLYVAAALYPVYDQGPSFGGGDVAVGVAVDGAYGSGDSTVVTSYQVADGLNKRSELDLGGWITDIQATPEALLVARSEGWGDQGSTVAVIDITNPDGTMVEGASVEVEGQVASQFNMDLHGDVLRIVSGGRWTSNETNWIQTFDVSDIAAPVAIDEATFGDEEELYATLFVGNKAFFVTYFVTDPFHAFWIGDDGQIEEKSEFIVSGWNDFFKTAVDSTRLLGVGIDDAGGDRTLAVSLYDITDLTNADPLVERKDADLENSWSEANWDHRAFTVVDEAVDVMAADGQTPETGLVLLPFSGWDEQGYRSGVQLFTYSATTLTVRGELAHDSPVRRSFVADEDLAAAISETSLSLHDMSDPDAPSTSGTLDLAPAYAQVFRFGDHFVRVTSTSDYWWYNGETVDDGWRAQIVPATEHPDAATPVAEIVLDPWASVVKVGDLLVGMSSKWEYDSDKGDNLSTTFRVYDLSDPTNPTEVGSLVTDEIGGGDERWDYGGYAEPAAVDDCWDCGSYWVSSQLSPQLAGDALVFTTRTYHDESAGTQTVCETYVDEYGTSSGSSVGSSGSATSSGGEVPPNTTEPARGPDGDFASSDDDHSDDDDSDDDDTDEGIDEEADDTEEPDEPEPAEPRKGKADEAGDTWYTGGIACVSVNDQPEVCYGQIFQCDSTGACDPVDVDSVQTSTWCDTWDYNRYWQSYSLQVVDLSDPASPALADTLEMPEEEEGVAVVVDGTTAWYGYRTPEEVDGDGRPYVKYFTRAVDLSDPSSPQLGAAINIPGIPLLADGSTLYTQDFVWNGALVESAVSKVTIDGDLATLAARKRFSERQVESVRLDGDGHALVTHSKSWQDTPYWYYDSEPVKLSVLDTSDLSEASAVDVDRWAELTAAMDGRALFTVPGGVLVMNLENAAQPWPQAYFATTGWPRSMLVDEGYVMLAADRYGIYRFDLDETNLLLAD